MKRNLNKRVNKMRLFLSITLVFAMCICSITDTQAQQDPQFTQYMFNTMTVNPAYVGSKGHPTIVGLGRTQWVGFEGAPDTQSLSYDTSLGYSRVGLGFSLVNDKIGPSHETYLDANVSYTVETNEEGNLAFGLKLGGRLLNIDWTTGEVENKRDQAFANNINNKFLPTIGAGVYYHEPEWYVGLAVPNFLGSEHYDEARRGNYEVAVERMHFFLIAGYVFDVNESIKFKPATLLKAVSGAPLSLDISANFLFNEKFRAGLAWRWDDSISALLGLQASDALHIGYAYDLTTSNYNIVNTGTHEIFLRYEIFKEARMKSPRFF